MQKKFFKNIQQPYIVENPLGPERLALNNAISVSEYPLTQLRRTIKPFAYAEEQIITINQVNLSQ